MVRIRGGSVSAGRTFRLRDEEDEDVQVVEPFIKSPKKKTGNRGGKMKQSARKKQNVQTREPSAEPSDEQMGEQQSEGHPVNDNKEKSVQPTNADVTVIKSPRKGKRIAKRKSIAQPKEKQTVDPLGDQQNAEKTVEEQQTEEPFTRRSPRTRSGVQSAAQTAQRSGKRKRPEQPETHTATEPTPLPKFIDDEAKERFEWISQKGFITQRTIIPYEFRKLDLEHVLNLKSASKFPSSNLEVITLLEDLKQHILLLEDGLMTTMTSEQQATFVAKRNLLVPPIPLENETAQRKEFGTEPTAETTPQYCASISQPQGKGKTPATDGGTEEDDDDDEDEDTEEEDPVQFRLARRRSRPSKITF
ncbi:uncharacterized protein LOC113780505 [Coffea eugenioides]|uniref:uncharacterized protein LOC113780505 n=1 Tax=Coffea eugenioides TaxID=49369 RepID=UPI000F612DDF|nr:uncharacterized protein LOC113780505 [Coffea eugenioides]